MNLSERYTGVHSILRQNFLNVWNFFKVKEKIWAKLNYYIIIKENIASQNILTFYTSVSFNFIKHTVINIFLLIYSQVGEAQKVSRREICVSPAVRTEPLSISMLAAKVAIFYICKHSLKDHIFHKSLFQERTTIRAFEKYKAQGYIFNIGIPAIPPFLYENHN